MLDPPDDGGVPSRSGSASSAASATAALASRTIGAAPPPTADLRVDHDRLDPGTAQRVGQSPGTSVDLVVRLGDHGQHRCRANHPASPRGQPA